MSGDQTYGEYPKSEEDVAPLAPATIQPVETDPELELARDIFSGLPISSNLKPLDHKTHKSHAELALARAAVFYEVHAEHVEAAKQKAEAEKDAQPALR